MEKIGSHIKRFGNRVRSVLTIAIVAVLTMLVLCSGYNGADAALVSSYPIMTDKDSTVSPIKMDSAALFVFRDLNGLIKYHDSVSNEKKIQLIVDSIENVKSDLIGEVSGYIRKYAPKSRMSAANIVDQCLEKDFDLPLLLSQAHQETHFATCGSNNCFGLMNGKRYTHPDQCVEDYISLMQRRYIINRTVDEALESNLRLEKGGGYYSETPTYSKTISGLRNNIIRDTRIAILVDSINDLNMQIEILKKDVDEV